MPGKYNYFQCPTCQAGPADVPKTGKFRIAVEKPPVNAIAFPACSKCRKTMSLIGEGDAPFAPSSTLPPAANAAALSADNVRVHHGSGADTSGRNVDFAVYENAAQNRFRIELTVNNGRTVVATLVRDQIDKQGSPERWTVKPPFGAGAAWVTLNTERMLNLRDAPSLNPQNALPRPFAIGMKLGTHRFGLIHLLAGHHANTRTWIGTANPSRMVRPERADQAEMQRYEDLKEEEESYRSIQGVQAALAEALAPGAIQRVLRDGATYILLGMSASRGAKVVVLRSGNEFSVTTMYIQNRGSRFDPPRANEHDVWVRPAGR